jgi:predicted unusual protein kinase regulating ubiquinone biosynthesis (AarF/ABC1/UbiB family)
VTGAFSRQQLVLARTRQLSVNSRQWHHARTGRLGGLGTTARLLAVATVSTLTFTYSADCQAAIAAPVCVPEPRKVVTLPLLPAVDKSAVKNMWDRFCHLLELCARWVRHLLAYSPAIITSPLLLLKSDRWDEVWWSLLRDCVLRSGPCSIKFAQWMATRQDLFPAQLCKHFQSLQSTYVVPKWEDVEPVLIAHYGRDWEKILQIDRDAEGNPIVIGGGCIAQVLKARVFLPESENAVNPQFAEPVYPHQTMKWKERNVAVKITHPGVRKAITLDIELMTWFSSTLETLLPPLQQVSLYDSVIEFSKLMLQQVDMLYEARNLQRLIDNFSAQSPTLLPDDTAENTTFDIVDDSDELATMATSSAGQMLAAARSKLMDFFVLRKGVHHGVHFPRPFLRYTNEDILVEEYEPGALIRDYIVHCSDSKKRRIARIGMDAVFKMVFLDNFVHAGESVCFQLI